MDTEWRNLPSPFQALGQGESPAGMWGQQWGALKLATDWSFHIKIYWTLLICSKPGFPLLPEGDRKNKIMPKSPYQVAENNSKERVKGQWWERKEAAFCLSLSHAGSFSKLVIVYNCFYLKTS